MGDLTATVLEKILDLLDRVKLVEVENERLRQRVSNLEVMQETPMLVPDQDPDELPPLTPDQQHTARKLGITFDQYKKVIVREYDLAKLQHESTLQAAVAQAQSQVQAGLAQAGLAQAQFGPQTTGQGLQGGLLSGGLGTSVGPLKPPTVKAHQSALHKIFGRSK